MSDADIPNRFGPAIRWVLAGIALFVFFLLGAEEFKEGKYISGSVFSGLFLITLIIAVKWDQIAAFMGRDKVTLVLIAVGLLCALGLGTVIGVLLMRARPESVTSQPTGRIIWNFDQIASGQANFLNMIRLNQEEIRVVGIGIHGKNTSNDPVSEFHGYVRSDLTNARLSFFIMAEDPTNATEQPNPFHPQQIPTRPEETFGIPGTADFDLVTYEKPVFEQGVDGVPLSQFLREFGSFTVVLQYDGTKVEQRFPIDQVKAAAAKFEKESKRERTTAPRVTRRPDATPPLQSMLPLKLPPESPKLENDKK